MAPVVQALRASGAFDCQVWSTGQHREMLDQVLDVFGLEVDRDLNVMTPGQTLNEIFSQVMAGADRLLVEERPDMVLVHGDTSTAAAAATAAFHRGIRIGHVEAGLRSGRLDQPWPEEFNRRLVDMVSDRLFAPTETARRNLIAEGVAKDRISVTGNTVIDALLQTRSSIQADIGRRGRLDAAFRFLDPTRPLVLVTGHRRESFGEGFQQICMAIRDIVADGAIQVVYPVHLNPNVQEPVRVILGGLDGVHLVPPTDYPTFVYLMDRADVILTDSGGVQEEAPSLDKPVLVMRDVTERPEAVEAGVARLVGADRQRIVAGVRSALDHAKRPPLSNPYGDGRAALRIVQELQRVADGLR